MKNAKLYYTIALTLFTFTMISMVADSYINYDSAVLQYEQLGYPTYLILLLSAAQIFGLIIIISNKGKWLLEWAYAGFFMNFTFGILAHLLSKNGNGATAVICLFLVWVTYTLNRRAKLSKKNTSLTDKGTDTHQLQKVA